VRHAWQGAIEAARGNAAIGPKEDAPHLQATAGAQAADLQGHAKEDLILESSAGIHEDSRSD
jgi:hypothetical protein